MGYPLQELTLESAVRGAGKLFRCQVLLQLGGIRTARLLLTLVPALSFLSTGAPPAGAQASTPGRADIIRFLRKGENQEALLLTQAALKTAPHDCSLLSLEGIAFTGLSQPQPALQSFQKALDSCPAYLPALEGAAQIEYAQHGSEAVPLIERILVVQPENPTANAMLATALRAQGRCGDALSHYTASKPLFPSRPDLLQGYGTCLANTGNLDGALAIYQQLLASSPNGTIRYDVALLQWKAHANDAALANLAPLLTEAQAVPALALASKIHEEKGETPQAVSLLREAILKSPDDVDNYLDFAAIAFTHKSFQVGIDILNSGLSRLPNAAALYVARGVLEAQLSRSDAAIADFEQGHRLDPKLSFAVDAVGIMQSQQHQNGQSLALFEKEAKQHTEDPLLQYLLAEQLSQGVADDTGSRLADAIAAAKRAVTLDPKYQAAHDLLAVLYVRANEPKLAIQQTEMALNLDPNDQGALYQEIIARRRSGETLQLKALTERLNEARKENERRQQNVDRYRLQEEGSRVN